MKILHSYCLNHNFGDYYLGIGLKNILRYFLPVELIAETNLQGTVFNEYYIDNVVNKKYDLLIIGGGGIIHGHHWPNGWFWLIDKKLISRIKIPFIVYGAGYNYFPDENGISEKGKLHLAEAIQRSAHFSVRNDGSHRRLYDALKISVPVAPDPGFHVNLGRNFSCLEREKFVVIQLANDKPEYRFRNVSDHSLLIRNLKEVIKVISRNYKVILAPHVYEDLIISREVSAGIENTYIWDFPRFAFDRVEESVGFYQNAEFVVAMRGHAQIIPFAFNTPVISLQNHPKHGGLMNELGLSEYNIQISDVDLKEKMIELIDTLVKSRLWYCDHLSNQNKATFDQTFAIFSEIKNRLGIY